MNISFYLQNKNISDVDCSNPMSGNPGIGGSEYMFIAIPFYLWQMKDNSHRIMLMANSTKHLPHHDNCIQVGSDNDLQRRVQPLKISRKPLWRNFWRRDFWAHPCARL